MRNYFANIDKIICFEEKKHLVCLIVFLIALILRLHHIDLHTVNMDEDNQSGYASINPLNFPRIIELASKQNQPPIDPMLQSVVIKIFGDNPLGIRLTAAITGSLTCLFIFLLLNKITNSIMISLFGTLISIFDPLLIEYSQYARPNSTGVFFSLFFLLAIINEILKHEDAIEPNKIGSFTTLGTFLFLNSVGFQPFIFISCASISIVLLGVFKFLKIERIRFVLNKFFWGTLYFLPILILLIRNRKHYLNDISKLEKFKLGVLELTDFSFLSKYYFNFIFLLPIIFIGVLTWLWRGGFKNKMPNDRAFFFFGIMFIIFPLVFEIVFKIFINYEIQSRYFLTFIPIILILTSLSLNEIILTFKISKNRKIIFPLLGIFFIFYTYDIFPKFKKVYEKHVWSEYDLVYGFVNENVGIDQSALFTFNLISPDQWNPGLYSTKYYLNKIDNLKKYKDIVDFLSGGEKVLKSTRKIYLIGIFGQPDFEVFKPYRNKFEIRKFRGIWLAEINNQDEFGDNLKLFLELIIGVNENKIENHMAYLGLINLSIIKNNKQESLRLIAKLKEIDAKGLLSNKIPSLN